MNIYVCGPTVYEKVHIGNLKPILTYDIFIRANRFFNKKINFVHNITDIDDKIIAQASKLKISEQEVAKINTDFYLKMLEKYNVQMPNKMPTVTENILGIIKFISRLIEQNHAYLSNGSVYFAVNTIKNYGSLSNNQIENNSLSLDENDEKRHIADFAVWKKTNEGIKFKSPWGEGRPGWHTECAYFIDKYFNGKPADLHGGGIDLIFPHHENENAQFQALHNQDAALEYKHTGLINFSGEKMSKSIGNLILADEFSQKYGPNTLRYIFLSASLTAPLNLTESLILEAKKQVKKFEKAYQEAKKFPTIMKDPKVNLVIDNFANWNFAVGLKMLHNYVKNFNINKNNKTAYFVKTLIKTLGFNFKDLNLTKEDLALLKDWETLREKKNWEKADKIRDILMKKGIIS